MNRTLSLSGSALAGVCLLISFSLYGQSTNTQPPAEENKSFFEIQQEFNDRWAPYNVDNNGYYIENGVRKKAAGWKQR